MNLYHVHERYSEGVVLVLAETAKQARLLGYKELGGHFLSARAHKVQYKKCNIEGLKPGVLHLSEDEMLERNLGYIDGQEASDEDSGFRFYL